MLWSIENLRMSDSIELNRLIEFLSSIYMADVSSTNLTLKCQSAKRLSVIIVKSITPSLVPSGIPLLRKFQSDSVAPILTACCLSVRKAAIQLMSAGSTSSFRNSVIKMLWSIRSKSFKKKSAKKTRAPRSAQSTASEMACNMNRRASVVEWPLRTYCRRSIFPFNCGSGLLHVNPSMAFASVHVSDIWRRSLLISLDGFTFGIGVTMEDSRSDGMYPSLRDWL